MTTNLVRRLVAGTVAGAAVVASVAVTSTAAHATLPGTVPGEITYTAGQTTYIANSDGTNPKPFLNYASKASWSPDGSRIAYVFNDGVAPDGGIWTARPDGSDRVHLTKLGPDTDPVWTADGSRIIYSSSGLLQFASSDGGWWSGTLVDNAGGANTDVHPTVSKSNVVAFERQSSGVSSVYQYDLKAPANPPSLLLANAAEPDYSPDGTKIAYTVTDPGTGVPQVWTAKADGTGAAPLTSVADGASTPRWSPDGASVMYTRGNSTASSVEQINVTTGQPTQVVSSGLDAAWQPVRQNYVDRVWGQDAIGTAIAASQWNYRDNGNTADTVRSQANAVVLSRADAFYDALVGSALAINKQAPLLITYPSSLDSGVQAEIKRVLGTSGTVYLLGGTAALPAAIESQLTGLGYTVKRLWGATAIETAIAIDKEITGTAAPTTTIVATGSEFYDALAAGAAAGANPGTTIVLTWGDSMPAASANYLNGLNPDPKAANGTAIVTGGGPGDRALNSAYDNGSLPAWGSNGFHYWSLVGANAKDTALLLAGFFFAAPHVAAVATSAGWYDALTGGAMIGANYGPLLLTDPSGLYGPVRDYLSADSGAMWDGVILGGTAALPDTLRAPIGDAIGLPGHWTYTNYQPITGTPSARSLTAQSGSTSGKATAGTRPAGSPPGVTATAPRTVTGR